MLTTASSDQVFLNTLIRPQDASKLLNLPGNVQQLKPDQQQSIQSIFYEISGKKFADSHSFKEEYTKFSWFEKVIFNFSTTLYFWKYRDKAIGLTLNKIKEVGSKQLEQALEAIETSIKNHQVDEPRTPENLKVLSFAQNICARIRNQLKNTLYLVTKEELEKLKQEAIEKYYTEIIKPQYEKSLGFNSSIYEACIKGKGFENTVKVIKHGRYLLSVRGELERVLGQKQNERITAIVVELSRTVKDNLDIQVSALNQKLNELKQEAIRQIDRELQDFYDSKGKQAGSFSSSIVKDYILDIETEYPEKANENRRALSVYKATLQTIASGHSLELFDYSAFRMQFIDELMKASSHEVLKSEDVAQRLRLYELAMAHFFKKFKESKDTLSIQIENLKLSNQDSLSSIDALESQAKEYTSKIAQESQMPEGLTTPTYKSYLVHILNCLRATLEAVKKVEKDRKLQLLYSTVGDSECLLVLGSPIIISKELSIEQLEENISQELGHIDVSLANLKDLNVKLSNFRAVYQPLKLAIIQKMGKFKGLKDQLLNCQQQIVNHSKKRENSEKLIREYGERYSQPFEKFLEESKSEFLPYIASQTKQIANPNPIVIDEFISLAKENKPALVQASIEDLLNPERTAPPFSKEAFQKAQRLDRKPFSLYHKQGLLDAIIEKGDVYRQMITPLLQALAFLITSDSKKAVELSNKWLEELELLAESWQKAPYFIYHESTVSTEKSFMGLHILRVWISTFARSKIKLIPLLEELQSLAIPDKLDVKFDKLQSEGLELLDRYLKNPEQVTFDSLFEGKSSLLTWPRPTQFLILFYLLVEERMLVELESLDTKKRKDKLDDLDKVLKRRENPIFKALISAASSKSWLCRKGFDCALGLAQLLITAKTFQPPVEEEGLKGFKEELENQKKDIKRKIKTQNADQDECEKGVEQERVIEKKLERVEELIEFAGKQERKEFDNRRRSFIGSFFKTIIDATISKHTTDEWQLQNPKSGKEFNLQNAIPCLIKAEERTIALNGYLIALQERSLKPTDESSATVLEKKEDLRKTNRQLILATVELIKVLASVLLNRNPNYRLLMNVVDNKVIPNIQQHPMGSLEEESFIDWIQTYVTSPFLDLRAS